MVGPPSKEDNRDAMNGLKISVVVLVAASAGLITFSGGGSLLEIGVAVGAGLVVGVAVLTYLVRIA